MYAHSLHVLTFLTFLTIFLTFLTFLDAFRTVLTCLTVLTSTHTKIKNIPYTAENPGRSTPLVQLNTHKTEALG
jgi:hypothetical protein